MIELILLAFALSMDAFAVSIGLGAKEKLNTKALAFRAGIFFGSFQAFMPLIGYLGGKGVLGWIENYAHIVAFVLLLFIGGKMIYEGLTKSIEEDIVNVTNRVMLILAIATSIDAMAAGFSLTLLNVDPFSACLIIGLTTLAFSFAGVFIGNKSGTWLEKKAEIFGGFILIALGVKILIF